MKKIEAWIITLLIKARIGVWIAKLFSKLQGGKTYIALVMIIAIKFCLYANYIPQEYVELANEILNALYGVVTISFGDKVKRYWEAIKKTGDDIIK